MMNEDCKRHLIQAQINEGLVFFLKEKCAKKLFFKWIFVVIFYSALHYFSAFLTNKDQPIPKTHKGKSDDELGGIDVAKNSFFTTKNGISDSVGLDYEQLFKWSCDIRYHPKRATLVSKKELAVALSYLEAIKMVALNEIGYMPVIFSKIKKVKWKKVNISYIKKIYNKRKNR